MPGTSSQKIKLIYLMRIFMEQSDEEHPLSTCALIQELARYGITAERKSVYHDINLLADYGLDIIRESGPKKGWFLGNRDFELPEVRLLMDAVQAAAFITPKKTRELLAKLEKLASTHQARDMQRQVYFENCVKCANEEIYYIIDVLNKAIAGNRQVSFMYYRREAGKGRSARNDGKPFVVSPYAMLWVDDHYYLVGNLARLDTLTHFRLDRMGIVELLPQASRGFEEVSTYRGVFDAADYAKKSFAMFGGEETQAELRCANDLLEEIYDRFGEDASILPDGPDHFTAHVRVHVSIGFIGWVLQFGTDIEVLAPEGLRKQIQDRIGEMAALYGKTLQPV